MKKINKKKNTSKCSCVKQFPRFPTLGSLNLVVKEINDGETTRVLYLSKSTNTTLKLLQYKSYIQPPSLK